jgi:hypothetical protein
MLNDSTSGIFASVYLVLFGARKSVPGLEWLVAATLFF